MIETVLTALAAFVSTDIDDLFLGMLCFAAANSKKDRLRVVCGRYLGTGSLILVSLFGAAGLRVLMERYLWLLGLVPIFLGIRAIFSKEEAEEERTAVGVIPVALLTIGSGADNIGVYLPLFAGMDRGQTLVTVGIFLLMIGVWSALSWWIIAFPAVQNILQRHQRWLVPAVYLLLGGYVILKGLL